MVRTPSTKLSNVVEWALHNGSTKCSQTGSRALIAPNAKR